MSDLIMRYIYYSRFYGNSIILYIQIYLLLVAIGECFIWQGDKNFNVTI